MRLDEIARRASEQVRTASNDMPLLPIEQVGAARRRARLLTAAGLAVVAFVAGALMLLPGPPNTPTVTDPTTTETTDGSPGEVRTAAVFTLDDLTVGEERTDQPFLLPWGEGEGQAGRGSGKRGPCCLAIGPDGAVLVLDQANHRVTRVDDTGARTLFGLGGADAVALTAGLDRVWVLTETGSSRELIAFDSNGAEAGRWTIDRGGEDPQLAVSPDRVWMGVTETMPVEAGFAPRQWLEVVDGATLEPVTDQRRSEHRPLPDGRRLGVIDSTVTLSAQDGDGVAWVFPAGVTIVSADPFLDGVLVTGTSGEMTEYGLSQAWLVRPDGSIEGFSFPHYLHATEPSQAMTAVSGDRLITLGSNEEGLLVSTVSLDRLGTSPPDTLDISDQEFLQMTQFGELYGSDGSLIADLDDFALSVGRVAWDRAAGIVYVAADGTLRHLDPDGSRLVTADLPEGATSRILGTVAGDPTLVGVVAEDALLWIDLASGERVDAPAGGVDRDPELGPVFTDQGRKVWVDTAGLFTAPRGEGEEPLGEYDLPGVVVEDAATGEVLTTLVLGTYERPYLRIHDFDGRRLIVSREPHEPAYAPLTVFIIDLECGDCTQVIETSGPDSFTLVGVSQSEGAVWKRPLTLEDGRPSTFVAVTSDLLAVEIATDTGEIVRVIGQGITNEEYINSECTVCIGVIDGVWRSADRSLVYVSACCEPASGQIAVLRSGEVYTMGTEATINAWWVVPSATTDSLIAVGYQTYVGDAAGTPQVQLFETDGSDPAGIGWGIDGESVFWLSVPPWPEESLYESDELPEIAQLVAHDLATGVTTTLDLPWLPEGSTLRGLSAQASGNLVSFLINDDRSVEGVVMDQTGALLSTFPLEPGSRMGGYDPSGRFLIYVSSGGTLRWMGAGKSGVLGEGFNAASW